MPWAAVADRRAGRPTPFRLHEGRERRRVLVDHAAYLLRVRLRAGVLCAPVPSADHARLAADLGVPTDVLCDALDRLHREDAAANAVSPPLAGD